jgi:hypothetical protein
MALQTRHRIDPNFKQGGGLGVIEQLDLTTSYPQTVAILDGSGNQITSFGGGTQYADGAVRGTATGTIAMGDDGTNIQSIKVDSDGNLQVDVVSITGVASTEYTEDAAAAANPVGNALIVVREDARAGSLTTTDGDNVALRGNNLGELYVKHTDSIAITSATLATAAKQDTGNTSVASIDTKTPALGQALAASSLPVVLTAAQITTLTPLSTVAVTGTFWQATQPVSGTVAFSNSTIAVTNAGTFATQATLQTGANAIGRVGHDITGIGHGVTTVTTAGTDVALAGSTACKRVTIQAQTDNTSTIAVGATGVDATVATGTGIVLYPGDVFELDIDNLADVFIDSLVNGEGVRYTYFS